MAPASHVYLIIIIQIIVMVLFGLFVRYNPDTAVRSDNSTSPPDSVREAVSLKTASYAMFQDVHVMIFLGFGFLMTFLKKYGLSAVSLNMLLSVVAIEMFTLVHGFFHLHWVNGWPTIPIDLST